MIKKYDIFQFKNNWYIVIDIDVADHNTIYISKYDNYIKQFDYPRAIKNFNKQTVSYISKNNLEYIKMYLIFKKEKEFLLKLVEQLKQKKDGEQK